MTSTRYTSASSLYDNPDNEGRYSTVKSHVRVHAGPRFLGLLFDEQDVFGLTVPSKMKAVTETDSGIFEGPFE